MTLQTAIQAARITPIALGSYDGWLSQRELCEPLRAAGTVIQVPAGREIFAEGDDTEVFYKVVSGVVRICKFLNDGRRQIEAFHIAGEVFGFERNGERRLSAEAVIDCTLVSYRRRSVEMLAQKDDSVTRQMFQYAMQSLEQAQTHSLLLGRRGAAEKVAAFLLDWAARCDQQSTIRLAMTRQDIADFLGLTIETVSRSLSQFERDGVIALPNAREVRILDQGELEELAA